MKQGKRILMTGGGTLGPVTPLLAVARAWQKTDRTVRISWIGTKSGPERSLITSYGFSFESAFVPKLSRHEKWTWPFLPFLFLWSLGSAFATLRSMRPDLIMSAGGYTSVPFVIAGFFLGIPSWIHQLDVEPGLANKIMAPFAKRIGVTWEESAAAFSSEKTLVLGGLVRQEITQGNGERFLKEEGLNPERPTLLIIGGGTGARAINDALDVLVPELTAHWNIVHITGKGKGNASVEAYGYVQMEFLGERMKDAYAAADVVVARAGMGTIMEIIALGKASILIPIPHSHQELNAKALEEREAARVIHHLTPQVLKQEINRLGEKRDLRKALQFNARKALPLFAEQRIVEIAKQLLETKNDPE